MAESLKLSDEVVERAREKILNVNPSMTIQLSHPAAGRALMRDVLTAALRLDDPETRVRVARKLSFPDFGLWEDMAESEQAEMLDFADTAIAALLGAGAEPCDHHWIDIRNEVVRSGEMCRRCGELRSGAEPEEADGGG